MSTKSGAPSMRVAAEFQVMCSCMNTGCSTGEFAHVQGANHKDRSKAIKHALSQISWETTRNESNARRKKRPLTPENASGREPACRSNPALAKVKSLDQFDHSRLLAQRLHCWCWRRLAPHLGSGHSCRVKCFLCLLRMLVWKSHQMVSSNWSCHP